MSRTYADAARLMVQPMAGAAALGALGLGMATQAFGLWLTAVSGAMRAGHEVAHAGETTGPREADVPADARPAATRARAAVDSLIAEARTAASEAKVVAFVSKAERAAKAKAAARKPVTPEAGAPVAAQPAKAPAQPRAAKADDLKAIGGVGPKLETVLNGLGFRTYAQIAALTADQIGAIEDHVGFKGRITRDDWIGQAKALMAGGSA